MSHPSWVRGLKRVGGNVVKELREVAPFMGAWIETVVGTPADREQLCRTLHGCVD